MPYFGPVYSYDTMDWTIQYVLMLEGRYLLNKKGIKDVEVKGKKVLVRVDFNVP